MKQTSHILVSFCVPVFNRAHYLEQFSYRPRIRPGFKSLQPTLHGAEILGGVRFAAAIGFEGECEAGAPVLDGSRIPCKRCGERGSAGVPKGVVVSKAERPDRVRVKPAPRGLTEPARAQFHN